ncbi:MAG: helix-turn-helix domain-containing protein [Planctomycetia bacterium]|nr:helix-turn-helix domain-containing protein [Planctomycetia bacterium]
MLAVDIPALLDTEQVAHILDVKPATLVAWRHHRRYPLRFTRVGRNIRYRREDVLAFLEARTVDCGDSQN